MWAEIKSGRLEMAEIASGSAVRKFATRILAVGALLAFAIAAMPDGLTGKHYYVQIIVPGSLVGLIVGYATQRFGRPAESAAAMR